MKPDPERIAQIETEKNAKGPNRSFKDFDQLSPEDQDREVAFVEKMLGRSITEFVAIHHPEHYNSHPSGVECITVVEHMSFNVGNAVKYLWRAGLKGAVLDDLRKAAWYVDREIRRLEKKKA